jgi:hypothetical protein
MGFVLAIGVSVAVGVHRVHHAAGDGVGVHGTDLQPLLVPVPASSRPWKTEPTNQTLDLEGASAFAADPSRGAEVLRRYGFERGVVRRWISGTGTIVELRLIQFDSTDDAGDYYTSFELDNNLGGWKDEARVAGIPEAQSFVKPATDKSGYQMELSFAQAGDIVVVIDSNQLAPAVESVGNAILASQYARL